MAEVKRALRVAARVHEELANLISRDAKDPRVRSVVISRVSMSDDLRNARVFVRVLVDSEEERKIAIAGLARATPMLRSAVTKRAALRFAPELSFQYDDGQDAELRVETLLEEVRREKQPK